MTVPDKLRPPATPRGFHLKTHRIHAGETWFRVMRSHYTSALDTGALSRTRYASPAIDRDPPEAQPYKVLYYGATYSCCFVEAILRDPDNGMAGDWPITERELATWDCVAVQVARPLTVVDMRDGGLVAMRIPTDVAKASDQLPGRLWSDFFYRHPDGVAGIIYKSRLCDFDCIALYKDRGT